VAPRAQREAANVLHHDHPFHKDGELLLDGLPGHLSMRLIICIVVLRKSL
jgi:hypothetical protein